MTGQINRDINLEQHVRLFRGAMDAEFVFMDDSAPPHRVNIVSECLQSEYITRMVCPTFSPDLNRIETGLPNTFLTNKIIRSLHHEVHQGLDREAPAAIPECCRFNTTDHLARNRPGHHLEIYQSMSRLKTECFHARSK
ncbi:transposable element Tcb1 transposase [Trichonephila clavipes]|nr:transposable element Tcb1 transposase [Trichonephila clavipes]